MPRVNTVKKSQKDQGKCGRCGCDLPKGSPYRWIKFGFGGGKYKRCMDPKCSFRGSDLTQSKMSGAYAAQENVEDNVGDCGSIEDVKALAEEAASSIREVGEEYQESADAISEHFEGSNTAEECETKAQELEAWADEIESAVDEFEDFEPANGFDANGNRVCTECGGEVEADEAYWMCCDVTGCGAHDDIDPDADTEPRDDEGRTLDEYVQAAREALEEATSNCPC